MLRLLVLPLFSVWDSHLRPARSWGCIILGVDITMLHQDGVLNSTIRVWWNTMTIENIGGHPYVMQCVKDMVFCIEVVARTSNWQGKG